MSHSELLYQVPRAPWLQAWEDLFTQSYWPHPHPMSARFTGGGAGAGQQDERILATLSPWFPLPGLEHPIHPSHLAGKTPPPLYLATDGWSLELLAGLVEV